MKEDKKIGVLIANLGTPDKPKKIAVYRFLKEFLSDTRVIKLPRILWWLILNFIVLPFRIFKVTKAYQSIWANNSSPLLDISLKQTKKLQEKLKGIKIVLAMRYGNPSISKSLKKINKVDELIILPLYPQYSATTTASVFDEISTALKDWEDIPDITFISRYYFHKNYINALKNSICDFWKQHQQADILLMSFHGLPQKYIKDGDPYYDECLKTAELLAEALGLSKDKWRLSFQSRMGRTQWLEPYTTDVLKEIARDKKSVQVVCPGFSVDCLETLEEIAIENKQVFLSSGGDKYQYIHCLNDSDEHIEFISQLILENIGKV
ncbi:Ferrochelatase, protoheme ferro-lyase [hydrothermal vent metagenome]|uniref:Ferrochelatase, protoheme ferro-lyase n=1 Tax=hydrothermal vent metagenome TaxID=652676 RepID=A0A1W1CK86_9ZZZZ